MEKGGGGIENFQKSEYTYVNRSEDENFEGNRSKNERSDVFLSSKCWIFKIFPCIKMNFCVIKIACYFLVQILVQKLIFLQIHYNTIGPPRRIGPRGGFKRWISMFNVHKFQNLIRWKKCMCSSENFGKIVFLIIENHIIRNIPGVYAIFWTLYTPTS